MVIKTWPTTKVGLVHKRERETQAHTREYNMFLFWRENFKLYISIDDERCENEKTVKDRRHHVMDG